MELQPGLRIYKLMNLSRLCALSSLTTMLNSILKEDFLWSDVNLLVWNIAKSIMTKLWKKVLKHF